MISGSRRQTVYLRAGCQCECTRFCPSHSLSRCDEPLIDGDWDVHHKNEGSDEFWNLEALCKPCHHEAQSEP